MSAGRRSGRPKSKAEITVADPESPSTGPIYKGRDFFDKGVTGGPFVNAFALLGDSAQAWRAAPIGASDASAELTLTVLNLGIRDRVTTLGALNRFVQDRLSVFSNWNDGRRMRDNMIKVTELEITNPTGQTLLAQDLQKSPADVKITQRTTEGETVIIWTGLDGLEQFVSEATKFIAKERDNDKRAEDFKKVATVM